MSEASGTFWVRAPVERSRVPLAGLAHVFSTQVVMVRDGRVGIGSGVPKLQPVLVQSGSAVWTAGSGGVAPIVQLEPVQLSA